MKRRENIKLCANKILSERITRKEALIKTGKYAAITAASLLIVLSPKESQAQSPDGAPTPGWGSGS